MAKPFKNPPAVAGQERERISVRSAAASFEVKFVRTLRDGKKKKRITSAIRTRWRDGKNEKEKKYRSRRSAFFMYLHSREIIPDDACCIYLLLVRREFSIEDDGFFERLGLTRSSRSNRNNPIPPPYGCSLPREEPALVFY